jgi:hypothetical protein
MTLERTYGSEHHLRSYLTLYRDGLDKAVQAVTESVSIEWLAFIKTASGDREYRGVEFCDRQVQQAWREHWPTTGRPPSWDAVGRSGDAWLLVEAKANVPEFCTPPSTASPESLKQITKRLNEAKAMLGVHRFFPWHGTYYQHANRLVVLSFLHSHAEEAHLVEVFFTGDRFPDGTECPASQKEWAKLIEARRITLGLPHQHPLSQYEHQVFLPALGTG